MRNDPAATNRASGAIRGIDGEGAWVPERHGATPVLGIVGGMGPLASAEFVRTIYEESAADDERRSPACLLHSDPSMPDRTDAILRGRTGELTRRLARCLSQLRRLGATRIVVCCVTLHHCLPEVPAVLRRRVISLLDVVVDDLAASPRASLLLCTRGVRETRLFERHPRWDRVRDRVVLPSDADQQRIHDLIYRELKRSRCDDSLLPFLDDLARTYGTRSFVAGCTEIHLLHKHLWRTRPTTYAFVDPLWTIARTLPQRLRDPAAIPAGAAP